MNKIFYEKPQHLRNTEQKKNSKYGSQRDNKPYMSNTDIEEQYFQPSYHETEYTEKEQFVPQKRGIKELIANALMIVLSIGLVINILIALTVIGDMNYSYEKDEERFWYAISSGEYAPLILNVWTNRFSDVKETEGLSQCYAVGEYFEAASLYKAADYTGNAEKKEKYAKIMEQKLAYFDDIMYIAEDIHMKLGIE